MDPRPVYSLLLFLSAGLSLLLAAYVRGRRRAENASDFGLFSFASAIYAVGYLGELWSADLSTMLLWIRFEYLGIAFLPTFWLLFALRYTGRKASPAFRRGLIAVSFLVVLVVFTLRLHGLFYVSPRLRTDGPFPAIAFGRGPLYWFWVAYLWGLFGAAALLFLRFFVHAQRQFRSQILLIGIAASLPLAGNLAYLAGLVPYGLEPSAVMSGLSALIAGLGLFRYGFLDLMPIARERVLEALEDGVLVVDREGRLVDANPAARAVLGLGEGSGGKALPELAAGLPALAALARAGQGRADFLLPSPSGERRYCVRAFPVGQSAAGILVPAGEALGTVLVVSDITEETELVRRLEELAATDGLTGLLNRRRFFELAGREVELARRKGRTVAVVLADLDHFKAVNDSLGHAAGDAVLKQVAGRFGAALRSTDLSCRYGGEEFAFLFPESDLAQGLRAAERLRASVASAPVSCAEGAIGVTMSLGLCAGLPGPDGLLDLEGLLRGADEALYAAKKAGRNRVEPRV